jgi:RES domain
MRGHPPFAPVYRLGHRSDPLGFVPWDACTWAHRWDDPLRRYRTLYCARTTATCLRESLADLRPSAKTIADIQRLFGSNFDVRDTYGVVSRKWLASHALVAAELWTDGPLVDIDDPDVRTNLVYKHAQLMTSHRMDRLDTTELTGRVRSVTQAISRALWQEGAAGIRYRPNLDNRGCYALFEGRAGLYPVGFGTTFEPRLLKGIARKYNLQVVIDDTHLLHDAALARPTDRRGPADRRQSSLGYSGPERRSGIDRRLDD